MVRSTFAKHLLVFLLGMATLAGQAQQDFFAARKLRSGDLLFHVADAGNAITAVTPGMIDHVAIYLGNDSVLEAVGRGVVTTSLGELATQEGHYLVGRVKHLSRRRSLAIARTYTGRAYDWLYLPDNADIYCSELVQLSYVDRRGRRLFQPVPMSFHDESGRITDYWTRFYERHGMAVPEGWPGTNPGEMSGRKNVKLMGRLQFGPN